LELRKGRKEAERREKEWNYRFTVTFSKDNSKMHKTFREYFDSPREVTFPLIEGRRKDKYTAMRLSR